MADSPLAIREEPATSRDASTLIAALDAELLARYPAQAIHGLHPGEATDPRLRFFIARMGAAPAGCGALRVLSADTAEIKRMYVCPEFRGFGVGRALLRRLESLATETGITCLRLEAGGRQPEALGLYTAAGYRAIPPYGEYVDDPLSLCFEKDLSHGGTAGRPLL